MPDPRSNTQSDSIPHFYNLTSTLWHGACKAGQHATLVLAQAARNLTKGVRLETRNDPSAQHGPYPK